MNPAALLTTARRRLSPRMLALVQTAAAGTIAWYVASLVTSDHNPVFASIAAIVAIGASHGEHRQRALQLAGGVVLGLTVADLIIHLIGTGAPQIGIMIVLAMGTAIVLGGSEIVISEAGVSAILLVASNAQHGYSPNRILEAVIGGGVALVVGALLFPPDPALQVGRAVQAVFGELGRALERTASALAEGDTARGERGLAQARAIDALIDELEVALAAGLETARTAPQRFAARSEIVRYERSLRQVDLAVRNTRVLARRAVAATRRHGPAPSALAGAVDLLADAVDDLVVHLDDPARETESRGLALDAARRATSVLDTDHTMSTSAVVAQVRATAVDLLRGSGLSEDEAIAAMEALEPVGERE
jgi:uncharacterized membrane protein YgaE (UPF0421/DUF939 family)